MEKSAPSAGFALIEVLVSLSLLSLLSLLIIATIPQLRSLKRQAEINTAEMELDSIANFVSGQLAEARALPLMTRKDHTRAVFDGSASSVTFVAVARSGSDQIALRDLTIQTGDGTLEMTERARRRTTQLEHIYRLSESNVALELIYCAKKFNEAYICYDRWREERLPTYVTLKIKMTTKARSFYRSRIIPLENAR